MTSKYTGVPIESLQLRNNAPDGPQEVDVTFEDGVHIIVSALVSFSIDSVTSEINVRGIVVSPMFRGFRAVLTRGENNIYYAELEEPAKGLYS